MESYRFVLTGGGTGGHVYPNIAIFEALKEKHPNSEFLYIGSKRGPEAKILESLALPIDFKTVQSQGLPASLRSLGAILPVLRILWGAVQSLFILRRYKPHLVIGTGGYVAAPVVLAAAILKRRIFLHEQNAVPGRMNRMMARFASLVAVSFESTRKFLPAEKTVFSGYPVRRALFLQNRDAIKKRRNIPAENKVVFIFSGSTGSRTINQALAEIIPHLLLEKELTVIVATGKSYSTEYKAYDETVKLLQRIGIDPEIEGRLLMREYFSNIEEIYAVADLIVARAGAGSVKEISSLALPAILIPKIDLPGDHQIMNAREIEQLGGARIVLEDIITEHGRRLIRVPEIELLSGIRDLLHFDNERLRLQDNLQKIKKVDTAKIILAEIEKLIARGREDETAEIKVHYLHSPAEEKNYELLFTRNTCGNTLLADHFLHGPGGNLLFEIRSVHEPKGDKLILKKLRGDIAVNDRPVARWSEIRVGDRISAGDQSWILNCYSEKVKTPQFPKSMSRKVSGASLGIFVSRVGGFFREVLTAAVFGASRAMDLFSVGFTLANLLRRLFAENALENAFLPVFLRLFHRSPRRQTWKTAATIVNFTIMAALICTVCGILLAPLLMPSIFPGLADKGLVAPAVRMTQIMLPYLVLVTIAAVMATYLKAFNRFGLAEGSAVFFSIGVIAGVLLLKRSIGYYSLAYGVLLGGLLQILFLLPLAWRLLATRSLDFSYSPAIRLKGPAVKKYFSQLSPIAADVGVSQVSTLVDKSFAATFPTGALSYLYYSLEIFRLPFAVIAQALSSVVLKDYSESIALFDREKAKKIYVDGINITLFLLIPVSILLVMLANPLISLLLQRFNFTTAAVANTAWALQFYALGLAAWGIHSLTTRIFAARLDNRTSMIINLFMLATHVGLCILLVKTPLRFAGIALATSLSYSLFAVIRVMVLKFKLREDEINVSSRDILDPLFKTLLASLFMICGILESDLIFQYIHFSSRFIQNLMRFVSLSFIGIAIYILASIILKNSGVIVFRKKSLARKAQAPVSLLSPFSFLELVAKKPDAYREEYGYKINLYLSSSRWEIRNVGVKLVGLFRSTGHGQLLCDLVRIRGENGFVRRNAISSLRDLRIWNGEIRELASEALRDRYYEIRVAALNLLRESMPEEDFSQFRDLVLARIRRGNLEEKVAALRLVAGKGDASMLPQIKELYLASNTLVREELLELLHGFYKRKIIGREELRDQVQNVLITSNNLVAEFKIKNILQRIHKEIKAT